MSSRRSESDLTKLRRLARECARGRDETLTTLHLLAAIWRCGGPASELLHARRFDESRLMQAARAFDEKHEDAVQTALDEARRIAHQAAVPSRAAMPARRGSRPMAAPEPSGIHVLVAVVSDRNCAAYRALAQCGVDISNLRSAATRIALGVVAPPRPRRERTAERQSRAPSVDVTAVRPSPRKGRPASEPPRSRRRPHRSNTGRAVQVPLIPPARKPMATRPGGIGTSAKAAADPTAKAAEPPPERKSPERKSPSTPVPSEPTPVARTSKPRPSKPVASPTPAPVSGVARGESSPLDPEQFPNLSVLRNLTAAAALGELEPAVAREREVEQALDVLAKRHANSPVLVGPAGVGKTTVAYAIAAEFAREPLERARLLLELPAAELLAGTSARGSLVERLAALRDEVKRMHGRVVLFVDELHELLDGGLDEAVAELKAALASGELPMLGATTPQEYRRSVESDPGLARRLTAVEVVEPNEADALAMLRAAARQLEAHHGIRYDDDALKKAVTWSIRYLPGRALPDKALGVLDLAGARLRRRPDRAAGVLEAEHVAAVMSELVDVPKERLMASDTERMVAMGQLLGERVVGHDAACERIASVLRRNAAGLRGQRPLGSFLLLGPTGVGKTETAKAISEVLFHARDAMTRLDMSEYAEPHALARLVGAPPGYVGHESGGLLTEAVRRRPYQVILLDEIEKAHIDVLQTFLQVLDEGRLTDGRGRTVDFTNTVVVLTSNIGARELSAAMNERPVGFGRANAAPDRSKMQDIAIGAARATLPPELYNRIDEVLFFRHLERSDVREVARRLLLGLGNSLRDKGITLDVDDAALEALLDAGGYDPELGARPMRRAIVRFIEAPLADMILRGEVAEGSVALVSAEDGEVVVDAVDRVA
jgi:ATP-dependent Clp protease ATP-binding subunit ClpC